MIVALIMWAAAAAAAVWKCTQLARMPRDRGLQIVTACTVLVLIALTAQLVVTIPGLAERFPSQTPVLIEFVLLNSFFALLLGLLHTRIAPSRAGVRGYLEIGLALLASGILTVTFVITETNAGDTGYGDYTEVGVPSGVLFFHLVGNLYMSYATARGAYLAWNSAGHVQSHTARGLRVAAVGLAICCLGTHVPRVLATSGLLLLGTPLVPGTATWTSPPLGIGVAVFFLGVGYPGARTGIAKARLWFEARSRYRQLRPLWAALHQQFPTIALLPPAGPFRDRLHVRQMRMRYYRRVIECRDGLVCLSPYMASPVDEADSPARQAALVRDALARCSQNIDLVMPSVIAAPANTGMEADTRAILALSREYGRGTASAAEPGVSA